MRLLINASNLKATGATQVAVSFINECPRFSNNEYFVFLSQTVANQIDLSSFPPGYKFYLFNDYPIISIKGIFNRSKMRNLERNINPECVFSLFGPTIWTPRSPHLMGYAYPYYIYPESPFFKIINFRLKLKFLLYKLAHRYYLKRNGRYYVCETEDVKHRLPKYIGCNNDQIYVVTNTYNQSFENFVPAKNKLLPDPSIDEFRFITLSSFTKHKNLTILNEVIPLLAEKIKSFNVKFVITIDEKLFKKHFNETSREHIYNIGKIDISKCPQIYYESDAMFLPTLMECFSASYAESMKMEKPIITSNLSFARAVCDNAALYVDPLNPNEIAARISDLVHNRELQEDLKVKGKLQLLKFDTSESRAKKYLEICKSIIKG